MTAVATPAPRDALPTDEVAPLVPRSAPVGPPNLARSTPGAGWLGIGAFASKGSQTAVLLIFAAVLEPDAFGVISLGAVLLNITTVLSDLGTSTALVHFRGDAERAARTAVTIALGVSLGLVAAVWLSAPWLARHLQAGELGIDMLRGIVLCAPLAAVAGVSAELLRRALDFRRRVLPDIVGNAVGAVVTVGALAAGHGALSLVYGQLVQAFLVLVLLWSLRPPVRPGWSRADASTLVSYGGSLAGGSLLTLVMLNADYVLIANRLGVHEVGVYSMAFRVAYMPYLLIAMVIGGAVFAHLCRMRGSAVGRGTVDAAVRLHALVVPAYVGILVLAPQLQLLGDEWAPAVPALRWLAAYGLVLSALELLLVSLKAVGRTSDLLAITALHLVVLLVLLALYVDRGVTAAAMAQLAAGVVTLVAAVVVVNRRVPGTDWGLLARRLTPVAVGAAALAATALVLRRLLPWSEVSVAGLVVVGAASCAAYVATVILLDRNDHTGLPLRKRPDAGSGTRLGARVWLYALLALAAVSAGALAVVAPYVVLATLVAIAVVAGMTFRVEWAALAYVAAEPFADLLRDVHPAALKVVGALLFVSWLARLVRDPRPTGLRHPGILTVGVLVLVLLASFVAHGSDLAVGLDHSVSYASYALVVLVLVDSLARARPDSFTFARRLVVTFALSCTAAGVVALVDYVSHGGRGSGPLSDPNDLAFFLIAALPFVLLAECRSASARWAMVAAGAVLVAATFATLSRGALLGLAVMVVVAVLLGALRIGAALGLALVAAVVVGALWVSNADVVAESLEHKSHIAGTNVDLRTTTWTMAAEMTAESPWLGQGPGGFAEVRSDFLPAGVPDVDETVAHQMYLDLSAELGLVGLAAFLAMLAFGVRGAVRARAVPERRALANAVLVSFSGALVAACFLSEQFYLPVWLLVALGLALDPVSPMSSPKTGRS